MKDTEKLPLIILTGPTAAGKTDLSINLAKKLNGEIISADSVQVYKKFDIGSAKITKEEMSGITHHLIDVYEPDFSFDVTVFQKEAARLVKEICDREKIPIIVGGTGFYIQALLYDVGFKDEGDDTYRKELESFSMQEGGAEELYEKLKEVDPVSAEIIHKNNVRKVIRALEYYHFHNIPISVHNSHEHQKQSAYNSLYFVINMDREILYERINKRVDIMREAGLVEEVKSLMDLGITKDNTSMQAIGYKELYDALKVIKDEKLPEGSERYEELLNEAFETIKLNTRHFAKRQLTWFRREKDVIWLDKDSNSEDEMIHIILDRCKERGITN